MIRNRVSIATMLGLVGLLAVGFAALRVSSRLWATACFSAALLALVVSVAGIIYRSGRRRAYWSGFALFGWSYLLIAFGPPPFNAWRELLITTPVLAILEDQLLDQAPAPGIPPARAGSSRTSIAYVPLSAWSHWTGTDRSNPFSSDSFNRIGHSLFTLAVALGGGVFARFLRETRDVPSPSP